MNENNGTLVVMTTGNKGEVEMLIEFLSAHRNTLDLMNLSEDFDTEDLDEAESFTSIVSDGDSTASMSIHLISEENIKHYCTQLIEKFIELNLDGHYYYKSYFDGRKTSGYGRVEDGIQTENDWLISQ